MVRVNLLNPKLLLDQHLLAEWNEIQMLLGYIQKYPNLDGTEPTTYTLGKGHMKFFKNKLYYLFTRLFFLRNEIYLRNYKTKKLIDVMNTYKLPTLSFNNYIPTEKDYDIIKERIYSRFLLKPQWYKYYGKSISVDKYKEMLCVKE
jgi:hypothetical protein